MAVLWLDDVDAGDIDTVGGKGASLGELTGAGLPVPPGFVVTAETYRAFIEEAGIDEELFEAVDVDPEDSTALRNAESQARELITETPLPDPVREDILDAYGEMGTEDESAFVAVRSSATAEDLPDSSFAGQQETFLNVQEASLLSRVKACWASLFTQRAIYYRQQRGFPHEDVDIAVVVQRMVDAEKSGVLFTSHPSTGDPQMTIEAAWGLGEAVVSGAVSPDNYVYDREHEALADVTVADKKIEMLKDPDTGETVEREVEDDRRTDRVLSDAEIDELVGLGERVETHYGTPQDVEWAIYEGTVYMLQSRPITTIRDSPADTDSEVGGVGSGTGGVGGGAGGTGPATTSDGAGDTPTGVSPVPNGGTNASATAGATGSVAGDDTDEDVLVDGLGASPGAVSGNVRIVTKLDHLDQVEDGDVLVTEMTMPDMVPAMKRAAGIVTDEGGMTSHAAIISRELGVPAVVGTTNGTRVLEDSQSITIDGDKGTVRAGADKSAEPATEFEPVEAARPETPVKPMTATEVKVNVSIPAAAERAAATGADGVGLLRIEHMVLSLGKTPERYIADHGARAYQDEIIEGVRQVADEFYPRPVRVRTIDAPTDEFRELTGGDGEPHEHNPMLGWRGARRSLDKPAPFRQELTAFARLFEMGYDNLEVMFPLVNDAADVRALREHLEETGIDPDTHRWGVMIETPASALQIDELAEMGIDFASFGTNDLTQYTLAVDRNNEHVADHFDELHPAVLRLIGDTIERCRALGVDTSICGQAGSKSEMVEFLVESGVSSISANIDAVRDVQHEVKRVEQRLLLDSVR